MNIFKIRAFNENVLDSEWTLTSLGFRRNPSLTLLPRSIGTDDGDSLSKCH